MLRSQRNEVFRAIAEEGLDARQFEWERPSPEEAGSLEILRHMPTGSYFGFRDNPAGWGYQYSPGVEHEEFGGLAGTWPYVMQAVRTWLAATRRETEQPDLWAELAAAPDAEAIGRPSRTRRSPGPSRPRSPASSTR